MNWWKYLTWPWRRRERIEAEKRTEALFKAQLREALLRQDNLREAVAQMKKVREDQDVESRSFRRTIPSQT